MAGPRASSRLIKEFKMVKMVKMVNFKLKMVRRVKFKLKMARMVKIISYQPWRQRSTEDHGAV